MVFNLSIAYTKDKIDHINSSRCDQIWLLMTLNLKNIRDQIG